jgi:hypothetical protein
MATRPYAPYVMRDQRAAGETAAHRAVAVTPRRSYTNVPDGGVPEWSNGPVLKGE